MPADSDSIGSLGLFGVEPLRVDCLPGLAPAVAAGLTQQARVTVELHAADPAELEAASAPGATGGVLLLSDEALPQGRKLAELAARRALVLHLTQPPTGDGDSARSLARIWSEAIAAGVQDVLSTAELGGPGAALRLHAAALRHRLGERARTAWATDLSTGLPHRQQLHEHMSQLLALRLREPAPMALLVLHVGPASPAPVRPGSEHAAALLRKLAVRLRSCLRASDVVASLGPNEFAVLLASVEAAPHVDGVVAKLIASARRPLLVGGQAVESVVHAGVARYPEDGTDAAALLDRAARQARSAALQAGTGFARAEPANEPRH